ncbi:protein qui-1-like [Lineus longissimus]|uniref:protein qui-1-like n=1 Tax=Lineus longissimus TaxID=88925 RepID=UPI00315D8988
MAARQHLGIYISSTCLIGNKYGLSPLPAQLEESEFQLLKSSASKLEKDADLVASWYRKNDASISGVYYLQPISSKFKYYYLRESRDIEKHAKDVKEWSHIYGEMCEVINHAAATGHSNLKQNLKEAFTSGVALEVKTALSASTNGCHCIVRNLKGVPLKQADAVVSNYTDWDSTTNISEGDSMVRLRNLQEEIAQQLKETNKNYFIVPWKSSGFSPETYSEHMDYLQNFIASVTYMLRTGIEFAQRGRGMSLKPHVPLGKKLQSYTSANIHLQYLQTWKKPLFGFNGAELRFRTLLERGVRGDHFAIMVEGPDGSGKSSLLLQAWCIAADLFGSKFFCVVRCVDLTTDCRTSEGILRSICHHINSVLKLELDFEGYSYEELVDSFNNFQATLTKNSVHWVFVIDGVEKLVINDSWTRLDWLFMEFRPFIHVIFSYSSSIPKSDAFIKMSKKLVKKETIIQTPELDVPQTKEMMAVLLKDIPSTSAYFSEVLKAISNRPTPLLMKLLCDFASDHDISNSDAYPESLENAVIEYFVCIEDVFGVSTVRHIAQYLSASFCGLSEMELLDILSCNNTALAECYPVTIPDMLRFQCALWIDLKCALGPLIEEYNRDGKVLLRWRHHCIYQVAVHRYLKTIDHIRASHRDIANLFLETYLESRPLVMPERSIHIVEFGQRWICPQPLLYSETKYNRRRLNELWFQLIAAGEISAFKEQCFCNFEYLLAKMHATSIQVLLSDLEVMQTKLLDAELYLVAKAIKASEAILTEDTLQLASELIGQLRKIRGCYPDHLNSLVVQSMQWCDSYSLPLLIPLTSWLPCPTLELIGRIDCPNNIGIAATNQSCQHVFCTNGSDVSMYHIASKKTIKAYKANNGKLRSMLLSYDNRLLCTGSSDGMVVVWSAATGKELHVFREHKSSILCLAITHKNHVLISGSKDKNFKVMTLEPFELQGTVACHQGAVTCIIVNSNDTVFATGSHDCKVRVWCIDELVLMNVIDFGSRSPIHSMALSIDNSFLIVGCEDKTVHLAAFITGTYLHQLDEHKSKVTSIAVARNCFQAAIGCADGKLHIYNFRSRKLQKTYSDLSQAITSVAISGNDSYVMGSTKDHVYFWKLNQDQDLKVDSQDVRTEDEHTDVVTCIAVSNDGKTAISGSKDGTVKVWNLEVSDLVDTLDAHNGPITCVAMASDDAFIVSGSEDKMVKVWSNSLGIVVTNFKEHLHEISNVCILKDNLCILSTDVGGVLKLWKADHGHTKLTFSGHAEVMAVSPCGLFSASGASTCLNIWTVLDGDQIKSVSHAERITCVVFTFDSQYIVTGSVDKSLKVWETQTGKLTQVLVEHDAMITTIAVTNCNQHVVSGSADTKILVWNLTTGTVEHHLSGHSGTVTALRLTSDGTVLISGSKDGTLRVWGVNQGCLITIFDMHVAVVDLQITHDASHIIVCLEDSHHIPLMCLHNTPATDVKSSEEIVKYGHGKRQSRQETRRLSPAVSIQFNDDVLFIDTNRSGALKVRILNDTPILPIPPKLRTIHRPNPLPSSNLDVDRERKPSPSTSSSSTAAPETTRVPISLQSSPVKAPIKMALESREKKRKYKESLKEKVAKNSLNNTANKKSSKICDIL